MSYSFPSIILTIRLSPQMMDQNNGRSICLNGSFFSPQLQNTGNMFTHFINNMSMCAVMYMFHMIEEGEILI